MSKPYSEDLRARVIQSYLNGLSKIDIVTLFKIGMDTLNRWIRQYLQTGDIKPKRRTQFRARKLSDSDLTDYIRNNPSVTLKQIAEHFSVKPSSIQARLKALNITYKKKQFLYEERDEQKRTEFVQRLEANASRGHDAQKVVYIDESGFHNPIRNE